MTFERRATVTKNTLTKDVPRKDWSVTLSTVQLVVAIVVGVVTLVGIPFGIGITMMRLEAESSFRERLELELNPPHGMVYSHVEKVIYEATDSNRDEMDRIQAEQNQKIMVMRDRIYRVELMMDEVYRAVVGREPPTPVTGEN